MSPTLNQSELLDLGAKPIRPDAPAGAPGRDEPEFELLQLEIRKMELPDGQQPDWQAVIQAASTLLAEKSKDLLPACYLAVGLFHRDGYDGFATGLTIVRDLVDRHWETLYPDIKRVRGRAAALEWLAERGTKAVDGRPPQGSETEGIALCRTRVDEITAVLEPKLESGWNALRELQRAFEEATNRTAAPPSPAMAPAGAPTPAAGQIPAQIQSQDEATRALGDLRDLGRKIADFLRTSEPANPLGYRLPRMVSWMHLAAPPPHADGQTQIPPPQPPDLPQKIESLLEQGQWAGVLEQSEARFASAVLWIDLHRYSASALEGMGEAFHPAAQAICDEVALLIRRIPGLESLSFQNGQPLADARTRAWIREKVGLGAAGAGADSGSAGDAGAEGLAEGGSEAGEDARFQQARAEARALGKRRKLPDALRLLEQGAAQAGSLRARTRWRLEMARLCMEAGNLQVALAQLLALDESLRSSTYEEWDPNLGLEVLKTLYLCHQKTLSSLSPTPPAEVARARELLGRLCRLDVSSAISLEGKG